MMLGQTWQQPRPLRGVRALRTTLRTAHLIAIAALYGGHVYGIAPKQLWPALLATIATGGAFVSLEVYRTPLWLLQLRGVATLAKVALVAAVAVYWDLRLWLLTMALIIGSVAAHMPGRFRYFSVAHWRVLGGQESG